MISYRGRIPASKSVLIRCLLLNSYQPAIRIAGDSFCEDVLSARRALQALAKNEKEIFCGEGALGFRLFALAASRKNGTWKITGRKRLLQRPHQSLISILKSFGVEADLNPDALEIRSEGWKAPKSPIPAGSEISSQFASALILNAWNLPFEIEIELGKDAVSQGYLAISIDLAKKAGMKLIEKANRIHIPAEQKPEAVTLQAESDLSSAFAVAALAAVGGEAILEDYPFESLQPDGAFVKILKELGVPVERDGSELRVRQAKALRAIEADLKDCPDLFPVLAALCAYADGRSRLHGAPQLAHKESDRISGVMRLLELLGRKSERLPDGLVIHGNWHGHRQGHGQGQETGTKEYNPDHDHRLAMAAAVARHAGAPITIRDLTVLNKSFPEFREIASLASAAPSSMVL